jgi:hypothetical protein
MSDASAWAEVETVLDRFAAAGRRAQLMLRDDDAVAPSPALDRLIDLCERHDVPLLLAVIPAFAMPALASRLAAAPLVAPCQHGYAHANHAAEGEKKREYGPDRPLAVMRAELCAGRELMQALFAGAALDVFVPPWNRIDRQVAAILPALGYQALSAFGPGRPAPVAGLLRLDAQLDIIDWHGTRGGRPPAELAAALARHLDAAFATGAPVGVLSHHLVHDEMAWDFLGTLLALVARHPGACWSAASHLLRQQAA